jgi:hypothetical protein
MGLFWISSDYKLWGMFIGTFQIEYEIYVEWDKGNSHGEVY